MIDKKVIILVRQLQNQFIKNQINIYKTSESHVAIKFLYVFIRIFHSLDRKAWVYYLKLPHVAKNEAMEIMIACVCVFTG